MAVKFKELKSEVVDLRLLFPGGNSQPHGHRKVVGEAGQLRDEAELFDVLQEKDRGIHVANLKDRKCRYIYKYERIYSEKSKNEKVG